MEFFILKAGPTLKIEAKIWMSQIHKCYFGHTRIWMLGTLSGTSAQYLFRPEKYNIFVEKYHTLDSIFFNYKIPTLNLQLRGTKTWMPQKCANVIQNLGYKISQARPMQIFVCKRTIIWVLLYWNILFLHLGGELAQWIASLSVKLAIQVCTRYDPLVS